MTAGRTEDVLKKLRESRSLVGDEAIGLDGEFLDGIDGGRDRRDVEVLAGDAAAVDHGDSTPIARAIHANGRGCLGRFAPGCGARQSREV